MTSYPKLRFLFVSGVLAPLAATVAHAQVSLSASLTAPTQNLIATSEKATPADGTTALGARWDTTISSHRDVLQIFTTSSDALLDSFTFKLNNQATPAGLSNAGYTVNVYQVASASSFPGATDTPLATYSGTWTLPTGTAALSYITFDLGTSVPLTAGKSYAFSIGFTSSAAGRNFLISTNGGDNGYYPGGVGAGATYPYDPVVAGTAGAWTSFTSDFVFYANAAAIPEPSSMALWMGGAVVIFAGLRRTRDRSSR